MGGLCSSPNPKRTPNPYAGRSTGLEKQFDQQRRQRRREVQREETAKIATVEPPEKPAAADKESPRRLSSAKESPRGSARFSNASDDEFYDGIPRYQKSSSYLKSRSLRAAKVSEMSSRLGRASSARLGRAVEVLDSLGTSVANLNLKGGFVSGAINKSNELSILSFEVANTIVKGSSLMQSLSKRSMRQLEDVILLEKSVQLLISDDTDELLKIVASDKREELKVFAGEVVRFGNRCKDPQWHNLDRFFEKRSRDRTPQKQLKETAESVMTQLMTSVQLTAELYQELHTLDKIELEYQRKRLEEFRFNAAQRGDRDNSLNVLATDLKSQKKVVKSLKKKSLWSKTMEEVMEKLVDIVLFLNQEINLTFGNPGFPSIVELNMEELSLPRIFEQSQKIHQAASDSSVDQDTVKKGCELLRKCEEMIGKLGLFSANETRDDISTANLKYILVPCYLGELMEKITEEDRIQILKTSQAKLKEFISFCEAMELVPKEELDSFARATSNTSTDKRAQKIARFKRQKAAESKLLEIREQKERRGRSTRASALSTPVEIGGDDLDDDDGEEEREAWLTTISLALCKAFDLLEMLKKEEEMLLAVREIQSKEGNNELSQSILDERAEKAEAWHRDAATRSRYTKPANPITCATFAQDVMEGRAGVAQAHEHKHHQPMIFGPASLVAKNPTSERERIAARVFQPHYRLPTMSIEEAGLKEMEIMNNWQEMNVKMMEEATSSWHNEKRLPRPTEDEDEDDGDAAQDKARAWDDWKDDNPRGAGNKKLTPCG